MLGGLALASMLIGASAAASQNQDAAPIPPVARSPVEAAWQLNSPKPDFRRGSSHSRDVRNAWLGRRFLDYVLVPQLERSQVDWFCDILEFGEDKRIVARLLYDEYERDMQVIIQRAYDARPFGTVFGAAPLHEVRPERLVPVWIELDRGFEQILNELVAMVPMEREIRGSEAIHAIRRHVVLKANSDHLGFYNEPAGDSFDLIATVLEAASDIPGLMVGQADETVTRDRLRAEVRALLDQYEEELDPLLRPMMVTYRETRAEQFAGIARNEWNRIAQAWRRDSDRWKRFYLLNKRYIGQIGEALAKSDAAAASQWHSHALRRQFPTVYVEHTGHLWRWLDEQKFTVAEEGLAQQAREAYEAEVQRIREECIEMIVNHRMRVFPEPLTPHWSGDSIVSREIYACMAKLRSAAVRLQHALGKTLGDEYRLAIERAILGMNPE